MVKCFGTFEMTADQADCDFAIELYGKEMGQSFLGATLVLKIIDCAPGKIACHWTSKSGPPMNMFELYHLGCETTVSHPLYGGKCTGKVCSIPDGYEGKFVSEKFGDTVDKMIFSDEGLTRTCSVQGKTQERQWKRVICEDGFYRMVSNENFKEFMAADDIPDDFSAPILNDFRIKWKACDSGYAFTEWFGPDVVVKSGGKFDQEEEYVLPFEGIPPSKVLLTRLGCGKYKCVVKDAKGGTQDWNYEVGDGTFNMKGVNLKNGLTCKIVFKKFVPMAGKWKTISVENVKEPITTLYPEIPLEMANQLANEHPILEIEDHCPVYRWNWKSEIPGCSMDITFKMDEEFEFFNAVTNETNTIVITQSGNKTVTISKEKKCVWKTITVHTDNFLINKSTVEGLDMAPMVYVLERC